MQHEQDPAQGLPVRHPRPARHQLRPRLGQQRLDERPQFVRHDPRPRLTLLHAPTNERTSRRSLDQQLLLGPLSGACSMRRESAATTRARAPAVVSRTFSMFLRLPRRDHGVPCWPCRHPNGRSAAGRSHDWASALLCVPPTDQARHLTGWQLSECLGPASARETPGRPRSSGSPSNRVCGRRPSLPNPPGRGRARNQSITVDYGRRLRRPRARTGTASPRSVPQRPLHGAMSAVQFGDAGPREPGRGKRRRRQRRGPGQ
ncbi:hypothetical protein SGRIM128S_02335 [Streptomyces griseomycini]